MKTADEANGKTSGQVRGARLALYRIAGATTKWLSQLAATRPKVQHPAQRKLSRIPTCSEAPRYASRRKIEVQEFGNCPCRLRQIPYNLLIPTGTALNVLNDLCHQ